MTFTATFWLLVVLAHGLAICEPLPSAVAAFDDYSHHVESRLNQQHRSPDTFLGSAANSPAFDHRLRSGELILERLLPPDNASPAGALLHHWRGTAFVAGARATEFERLLRDVDDYPRYFSPDVLQARVLARSGDELRMSMRVRQQHVITVVLDACYDVTFGRLDSQHRYSISRSTRIAEIDSPGTPRERALSATEEHGFLWRQITFWSYEERDGGLYLQIESISLTRSIPHGLAWAVRPFIESIPRDSLTFTLRSVCNALRTH
jgi:hypothetical protein